MTVLCVDFGGSSIKLGLADGTFLGEIDRFPVSGSAADLERVAEAAAALGGTEIDHVTVAVPGLVDPGAPRMVAAHGKYAWMLGADLGAWARDAFGAAITVENDARSALIGETSPHGCAPGAQDAVILVLGTGIGTAAMLSGQPLRGPDGSAGILGGHVTIDWRGPICNCGNTGCAEVYGGSWALADRIRERPGADGSALHARAEGGETIGFAEVFGAADTDPVADAVLRDAIEAWGVAAVSLCHSFDPRTLILAGGVARAADRILPTLERMLDERLWATLPRPQVVASTEPELSVLRGLAVIGAQKGIA